MSPSEVSTASKWTSAMQAERKSVKIIFTIPIPGDRRSQRVIRPRNAGNRGAKEKRGKEEKEARGNETLTKVDEKTLKCHDIG